MYRTGRSRRRIGPVRHSGWRGRRFEEQDGDVIVEPAAGVGNQAIQQFVRGGLQVRTTECVSAVLQPEKAYAWVTGLSVRPFVGTESRLHIVVELLRQIIHGAETDPQARLAELHRRRDVIDREIAEVEAGNLAVLGTTALRDRYQQFAATARDLLSDFREVEENFRGLDRAARERIAAWDGGKGDLLGELVSSRSDIDGSDQGRSFQAFYDFLLSETRQDELTDLPSERAIEIGVAHVSILPAVSRTA